MHVHLQLWAASLTQLVEALSLECWIGRRFKSHPRQQFFWLDSHNYIPFAFLTHSTGIYIHANALHKRSMHMYIHVYTHLHKHVHSPGAYIMVYEYVLAQQLAWYHMERTLLYNDTNRYNTHTYVLHKQWGRYGRAVHNVKCCQDIDYGSRHDVPTCTLW